MSDYDDQLTQDMANNLLQTLNISADQAMLLAQTAVSLSHTWTQLTHLAKQREALSMKPLCTATCISTEHARHGSPRYRALHGKDVSCPLHGTPDPGRRLRPRLRPIAVDHVRTAIDRWQHCTTIDCQAATLQAQMQHLEETLSAYQPFPQKNHKSQITINYFPPEQQ